MSPEEVLLVKLAKKDMVQYYYPSLVKEIVELLAQPEQPEQEPVAWLIGDDIFYSYQERGVPLYAPPQQREPLSDEEMRAIWKEGIRCEIPFVEIGRAIEKAHGIGGGNE